MRLHPRTSIGLALAAFGLAAASAQPASAAAEVPTNFVSTLELPADARDYTDLGQVYRRPSLLSADGKLLWLWGRQRTRDDAKALGVAIAELNGSRQVGLATLTGSVALRGIDRTTPFYGGNGIEAFGGGTWFIDRPLTPRPARDRLVEFNDRLEVARRITAPKNVSFRAAVATTSGLRLVAAESRRVGKRVRTLPVVVDGKRIVRQPYLADVTAWAPLPDGSLLLTGSSRGGLPDPVIRVTPKGKVTRLADRRDPSAAQATGRAGMVATSAGIVMDERTSTDEVLGGGDDLKSALVLRRPNGKVTKRVYLRDLDYPKPAACQVADVRQRVLSIGVGPDGLPVVRITCSAKQPDPQYPAYSYVRDVATTTIGLSSDLTATWWRVADEAKPSTEYSGQSAQRCGSDTIGMDGQLYVLRCNGTVSSSPIPGALPVTRGKLVSKRRESETSAAVRITCAGPYGARCSGQAKVTAGGVVLGTSVYTVPARPRKARGEIVRHVKTTGPLPKQFSVELTATP